ncbi:hypothetical protein ACIGCO_09820, partial [Serratia sp. NPDC078756]|uniref:hypothetical protein n=1 Tax=Serratia sp. NPDC078756 TaxID=3364515 RepID=UPI0037D2B699
GSASSNQPGAAGHAPTVNGIPRSAIPSGINPPEGPGMPGLHSVFSIKQPAGRGMPRPYG